MHIKTKKYIWKIILVNLIKIPTIIVIIIMTMMVGILLSLSGWENYVFVRRRARNVAVKIKEAHELYV